jgi:hypothetical protein
MPPRRVEISLVAAQPRPFQVRIALVKPHRSALGDFQGLDEVRGSAGEVVTEAPEGSAGQEAEGEVVLSAGPPQAVHRPVQ